MIERKHKKSVDKLCRDMVTSIINKEIMDMLKDDRDLTEDRKLWLVDFGSATACNLYSNHERKDYGLGYFRNRAKVHATKYVQIISNSWKEVVDDYSKVVDSVRGELPSVAAGSEGSNE
jgi:predicted Ser/Thr protein kinase